MQHGWAGNLMEPEVEWYDGDYIWEPEGGNLHEDALESLIYIYIYWEKLGWSARSTADPDMYDVFA